MMTNNTFVLTKLKELLGEKGYIRGPFGSALRRPELKNSGIPVYEQQHAIYNHRDFRFYIDEKKFEELKRFQVKTDDLIISCSGTVGRISIIRENDPKGIISQALLILRPNKGLILPKYLYYYLSSKEGFNQITQASHGSVQVNIARRTTVESIRFNVPSIIEQERILNILTNLDDKIELNLEVNKTLEEMAMAIYKEWFVDSNTNEYVEINNYIEANPKLSIKRGASVRFVDMQSLPTNAMSVSNLSERSFSSGSKFQNGDTLLARITPCLENGKTAFVDFLEKDEIGNGSTEFIVLRPKEEISNQYVYCLCRDKRFRSHAVSCMTGTSGRQRVQLSPLMGYPVKKIDMDIMKEFHEQTKPYFRLIRQNTKENKTLTITRDYLLPKLIKGEIRSREAEDEVIKII